MTNATNQSLTVGELVERLRNLNPETTLVVEMNDEGYWRHVSAVLRPEYATDGTEGYAAATLLLGDELDPRDGGMFVDQPNGVRL